MSAPDTPRPERRTRGILLMLATISALGSMAIHMMVPALPLISAELGIGEGAAQRVISFYLFGLAGGQLLVGPLVDRLGRRPVLLAGLALYSAAALLGAFAPGATPLLGARMLQAMGASAGLVTARVLVGDLFDRAEAGRRQATLMSVVLLSPAVAPLVGGLIAGAGGWRPIMGLLAGIGTLSLLASARFVPESMPRESADRPKRHLLHDYATLARNRRFVRAAAAIAGGSSALYMFLAVAPFLLISRWGMTPEQAALCFLATAAAGIGGTLTVGWFERRGNALRTGLACTAAGALIALVLALAGAQGSAALIGPIMIMMAGAGITAPACIAIIIHAEEGLSGTAASLSGAVQMLVSGSAASLLGLIAAPSFLLLSVAMLAVSLFAFAVAPRS